MSEQEDKKNKVIGKLNELKSNIGTFVADINVNDLKKSFNSMVKDAQKDFNKIASKDLEAVRKKLKKEKNDIEKKAKKFLEEHKKELGALQAKFDKLMRKKGKTAEAPKAAATTTKKKPTKKVAKAVKKVSTKKAQ